MRITVSSIVAVVIVAVAWGQDQSTGTTVIVPAAGDFSKVDVEPTMKAVRALYGDNAVERQKAMDDIQKNSANYAPPAFFALAHVLWGRGEKNPSIYWFNAGRLRGRFDAARCADVTARHPLPRGK